MSTLNLIALLPLIILSAGAVLAMLAIAFWRSHALIFGITLVTLLLAIISILPGSAQGAGQVTPLLVMDGYAYFIIGLVIAASFVVTLFTYGYYQLHPVQPEEFYLLLLSAALGACVLAASSHFASLFLGLEILSISLYAMVSYSYNKALSIEAGVKYLILASSSAAFLLFGMALVYAQFGSLAFTSIAASLSPTTNADPILLVGLVMMLVGFGFKLALVPFHLWTADVYEGAPVPVTAFIASISKGSMFAVLLRFFYPFNIINHPSLLTVFMILAIATMLIGSLLALLQSNLKRLLAYSSIANLGYLLVAFMVGGSNALTASTFYLVSYFVTILAAFGVVTVLSNSSRDAGLLEDYRGLFWRHPWLAATLTFAMFSLAGIPLTVGFVGKFYLVFAGVGSSLWLPVFVLVGSSAIGLYYYLRVVAMLFAPIPESTVPSRRIPSFSLAGSLALAGLVLLLLWLGVYPSPLIQMVRSIATFAR